MAGSTTTKRCPFCAEEIQAAAVVCRYCGRDLDASVSRPAVPSSSPYMPQPAVPQKTNGLAIASMVLGIVWIYGIGSILALIFGYQAKNQILLVILLVAAGSTSSYSY